MTTLFDIPPSFPPGFYYYPEFLTGEEETGLLETVQQINVSDFTFEGYKAKRRTASFGFDYHFDSGELTEGLPIPSAFRALTEKVSGLAGVNPDDFKELLVTQYPPGSVINWHRDASPFRLIAGVSLQAGCRFRLRPYGARKPLLTFPVEQRSLYVMEGEVRSAWQHSILPVASERYSITLRTLY
ncbi:alpha-ketoglutarate-dependent dioxygenase AlkB [Chitinophaga sp. NPDC101104]|uniref:alpha-ketoglutarate-dependent dioxygenase AlkB n=1 Tax=Chitinophaga sp. NPDC101104 TaxID=3390561 RepID=UPI003D02C0AC